MNMIKSKEELEERIKFFKRIYNSELIEYYNSLLNLEVSSLNGSIIPEDIVNELSNTTIYKDLTRYNIYKHAENILTNNPEFKRLTVWREELDFIIPSKIKDYNVYSYNPSKDEVCLFDLTIDEPYRLKRIDSIKKERVEVLDKEISKLKCSINNSNDNSKIFNLNIERDQLEQTKDIALLEIKSLSDRANHEDYANEVKSSILGVTNTFKNFYNISELDKTLKIGNTKIKKHTYHY